MPTSPAKPSSSVTELTQRYAKAMALLRAQARPEQLAGMQRFAMHGEQRLGVAVPQLRALGKALGTDHELALQLWDTGIPDAQILASLLVDPQQLSLAQMDGWTQGMQSWDVCDQACLNAFRRSPLAWACISRWAAAEPEYVRRCAFSLLAVLAVHDKRRADTDFSAQLGLIEAAAGDARNFVKKSVNWALRQIGKRSPVLRGEAMAAALRIQAQASPSARWIAADALRELRAQAPSL